MGAICSSATNKKSLAIQASVFTDAVTLLAKGPSLRNVVEADRFADAAVRQGVEPDPAAERGLADAVGVLADGDPAARLQAGIDDLARREAEDVEVGDAHDRELQ